MAAGITTTDMAQRDAVIEKDRELLHEGELRYGRRSDLERQRIERRSTSLDDYEEAFVEMLSRFPVAIRQVLRDRNHYDKQLVDRIKDAAFEALRPKSGDQDVPVELSDRERSVLVEMWRFWGRLSPSDREQFEEYFLDAAGEKPRVPSYLVLELTRTGKGMQRAARQDWQLPEELRRQLRLSPDRPPQVAVLPDE